MTGVQTCALPIWALFLYKTKEPLTQAQVRTWSQWRRTSHPGSSSAGGRSRRSTSFFSSGHSEQGGPCPRGHFCPRGTSFPLPCPAGFYSNLTGQASCFPCPAGFYCPGNLTTYCGHPCPAGFYCPRGECRGRAQPEGLALAALEAAASEDHRYPLRPRLPHRPSQRPRGRVALPGGQAQSDRL